MKVMAEKVVFWGAISLENALVEVRRNENMASAIHCEDEYLDIYPKNGDHVVARMNAITELILNRRIPSVLPNGLIKFKYLILSGEVSHSRGYLIPEMLFQKFNLPKIFPHQIAFIDQNRISISPESAFICMVP